MGTKEIRTPVLLYILVHNILKHIYFRLYINMDCVLSYFQSFIKLGIIFYLDTNF